MRLENVAAIVTGGASGLGAATARTLTNMGAKVAIFDIDETKGCMHADAIGAQFVKVDISRENEVVAGIRAAEDANGVARVLVNCAGIAPGVRMIRYGDTPHPVDLFNHVIAVNLTGSFSMAVQFTHRLFNADLIGDERGVIINTSSIAAYDGHEGHVAYAASKGGLVSMTLPMARDLADYAIRVMTIAPGLFETAMLEDIPRRDGVLLGSQVPFPRRLGEPDEFANLVLAIIDNPMLNGEVIRLDGALRMMPDSIFG